MKIIPWSAIPPESLISSTVSDAVAAWDADVTYFAGNMVYGADGVTVYEAAVGPATFLAGQYCGQAHGVNLQNKGFDPDDSPTVPAMDRTAYPDYIDIDDCYVESGKLWWIKRGPYYENKYRVFDESPDLETVSPIVMGGVASFSMVIEAPRSFDSIAFVRANATWIQVSYSAPIHYAFWESDKAYTAGERVRHNNKSYQARHTVAESVVPGCPTIYNRNETPDGGYLIPTGACNYSHAGEPFWDLIPEEDQTISATIDLVRPLELSMPGGDINKTAVYRAPGTVLAGTEVTITVIHNPFLRSHWDPTGESQAKLGLILMGFQIGIGLTLYGTSTGIVDYSKKERDAFGRAKITERGYTNKVSYKISIDTNLIYPIKEFLSTLRARVSVYIGDDALPETIVAGYFKDFAIPIESYSDSIFTLEVEGL